MFLLQLKHHFLYIMPLPRKKQSAERKKLKMFENKELAESTKAEEGLWRPSGAARICLLWVERCVWTRHVEWKEAQGTVTPPQMSIEIFLRTKHCSGAEQTKVEHFIKTAKTSQALCLHCNPCEVGKSDPLYRWEN